MKFFSEVQFLFPFSYFKKKNQKQFFYFLSLPNKIKIRKMQQQSETENPKAKKLEISDPTQITEGSSFPAMDALKAILTTKNDRRIDFSGEKEPQTGKKFRFSRNNFLSLNNKDQGVLNKIDAAISAYTTKSSCELKNSMKVIDRLENKGFKLNPLIYLSANEQSLLEEITKQYERMVKENNQSRSIFLKDL